MSDIPDYRTRLDLAEIVSRIERQQEETRKYVAEQHKLRAEADKLAAEGNKFSAEQVKLFSEAKKLSWDRWIILPLSILGAILAALIARLDVVARVFGWLP